MREEFSNAIFGEYSSKIHNIIQDFPTGRSLIINLNESYCSSLSLEKVNGDVFENRGDRIEELRRKREARINECQSYAERKLLSPAKAQLNISKTKLAEENQKLQEIADLYKTTFSQDAEKVGYLEDVGFLDIDGTEDKKSVKCSLPFFKSNKVDDFINKYATGSDINIQNLNDLVFKEVLERNVKKRDKCARAREYNAITKQMLVLAKTESQLLSIIGKEYICHTLGQNQITIDEIDRISRLVNEDISENEILVNSLNSYLSLVKERIKNNQNIVLNIGDGDGYTAWDEFYRSYSVQCNNKSGKASDYIPRVTAEFESLYREDCVNEDSDLNISECRIGAVNRAIDLTKAYVLQNQEQVKARNENQRKSEGVECSRDIRDNYCKKAPSEKDWKEKINKWGVSKCLN